MRAWLDKGGQLVFLTLTMPHSCGDSCVELLDSVGDSFSAVFSGRPFRRDRETFGIHHWFRAWDAPHGQNGWHPHIHAALFVAGRLAEPDLASLRHTIFTRWRTAVVARGHNPPSETHGIHVEMAREPERLAGYLLSIRGRETQTPIAFELTRGDLKRGQGKSPFELLQSFLEDGTERDLRLFREWCKATKGRHFARWSRGARDELLGDADYTEDVIEDDPGQVVFQPSCEAWLALRATPGALYQALLKVECGGPVAVSRFVADLLGRWKRKRFRLRGGPEPPCVAGLTSLQCAGPSPWAPGA